MKKYLVKRVLYIIITLWIVLTITFIMMKVIPGGPFVGEKNLPAEVVEALEEKYHLNDPLLKQYFDYLKGIVTFDMGPSFKLKDVAVQDLLISGFPVSAKLGAVTVILIIGVGIPFGIFAAIKRSKWQDYLATVFATAGIAIPTFVAGALILYIFGAKLKWIPTFGLEGWNYYIGPCVSLAAFSMAFIIRLTRSSMIDVLSQDYIRTARAKGLPKYKVIGKHALKNAMIPVVTYLGPMTAGIMTGSFVTEKIFAIPGMGSLFVEAITNRDYTVIMATTFFYAALAAIMILIVDIVYVLLDPRIKYEN